MGQVFLARDPDLDREIALKVLRADHASDPAEAVSQLRDEARAVAGLRHPNIVTVYEISADGDQAYIAMEYIDGSSLRSQIDDRSIGRDKLLKVVAKVARALEAAHLAGVLHRDIKPDNVMLDAKGVVKVVDFGIALRLDGERAPRVANTAARIDTIAATIPATAQAAGATAQTIFGTPAYMAPEVIFGEPPLPTSDVYALGVLLFEGLTGRLPYLAQNALDALTQAADPEIAPESLAELAPDARPELVELVESMLAHDASERPDAAAVATALEAMTAPTTKVVAPRIPTIRPAHRSPWIAAAIAVCAAAAAVIAVIAMRDHRGPAATPPIDNPDKRVRVAVAPVDGDFSALGHAGLAATAAGNVLVKTLEVAGVDAELALEPRGDVINAARDRGVDLVVLSRLELEDERAQGKLEIIDAASGERVLATDVRDRELASALTQIARAVLAHLGADLEEWSRTSAQINFELGFAAYTNENWPAARLFLEQATRARRDFPTAWFYLTWARGWHGAPAEVTQEAARTTLETATTGIERALGEAMVLFVSKRYREAAGVIEPVLARSPRDRDLLYTYAESLFHDGQVEKALDAFDRCIKVAPRFQPAARHPLAVAAARRDTSEIRRWSVITGVPYAGISAYLTGDYALAAKEKFKPDLLALLRGEYDGFDARYADLSDAVALAYVAGRAAMTGDRAAARARFARAWPSIAADADKPRGAFDLQVLGRALIMADYPKEVEQVRRWWRDHEAPVNLMARQELAVFGAPLTGADLPIRTMLTTRMASAAEAIDAGRSGDHDRAIELLEALLAQPDGRSGDYMIADALIRALVAAGRNQRLADLCADWRHPGFYEISIVALWAHCDEALK